MREEFKNKLINAMENEKTKEIKEKRLTLLNDIGAIEFEQLKKLSELNYDNKEEVQLEINKSNAMANTSKMILQSIGTQLIIEKNERQIVTIK